MGSELIRRQFLRRGESVSPLATSGASSASRAVAALRSTVSHPSSNRLTTPATSFLLTAAATREAIEPAGFRTIAWQDDTETAYNLLCVDERARLKPGAVAAEYLRSGTPQVGSAADADREGRPVQRVEVRWIDGGAVTSTVLTVVNEDGAHVCGISATR